MLEFNVEIRFPSKVYTKAPFIYSGPDFKALSLGFLSDFLTHEQKEYQRLYPLTVSESHGNSRDLLFSFLHLYVNKGNEKVANLSHPIEINESEEGRVIDRLFFEAGNIAKFYGSNVIELETHDWSDSDVCFPSSTSFLHLMKNSSSLIKISKQCLENMGFQCENTLLSYVYKNTIPGEQANTFNDSQIVKTLSPKRYHEIKKTVKFDFSSYELEKKDELFKSINLPFFEKTNNTLNRTVGWITKREKTEGMLRWMPNLFEPCLEKNSPYPLLFIDSLEKYQYKSGKIFDWRFNEDPLILRRLILTAFKQMNEIGIEKIHFSNVEEDKENIKMLLEELGFEENHETIIFRKRRSE